MISKGSITFDSRPASQWYHGSDLTCEICHKSFVDFTYYCTHIRTVHQISKEQYNEKYGTAAEAFRLYRCLCCGISIKWTYQSICGHLKSHEMATDGLVGPLDADATAKTSVQTESLCCCSILFIVLFFGDLMNSSDVGA